MSYSTTEFIDQEQRLASYEAIEQIYLEGMGDAMNALFPQMAEITYLQGYAEGMRLFKKNVRASVVLPVINTEIRELPLVCGQCVHLVNGRCHVKDVFRKENSYACDRISVNTPF